MYKIMVVSHNAAIIMTIKPYAIVVALVASMVITHSVSAGWFDKLKESSSEITGSDVLEVTKTVTNAVSGG